MKRTKRERRSLFDEKLQLTLKGYMILFKSPDFVLGFVKGSS